MHLGIRVNVTSARRLLAQLRERGFDTPELLELVAHKQLQWIDDNFRRGGIERRWAPLRPNTIASRRGGSSKPLMDTGRLRGSFTKAVRGSVLRVGTRDRRAPWHQHGTRPYTIRPVNARRLRFMTTGGMVFAKKVNHPGLPARPMLPSPVLAKRMSVDTIAKLYRRIVR